MDNQHVRVVFIKTFGCKVNYSESVSLAGLLREEGFTPIEMGAAALPAAEEVEIPVVFINSCCVTLEAERKALQFVRSVKRQRPDAEVLFTGCGARNFATREKYAQAGARVFSFYTEAFEWLRERRPTDDGRIAIVHAARQSSDSSARSRGFLKVQDGCHNCCSFCIIPFVRPYASLPVDDVLAEARSMLVQGKREIVLTGVNIGHYGLTPIASVEEIASASHFKRSKQYEPIPGHPGLCQLIEALLEVLEMHLSRTGVASRLRISSIEPEDIEPAFFDFFTHPQMCPHLHLPLQSGSDKVLVEMRRQYTMETFHMRAEAFRRAAPQGALTTDIICGHPGESEADFDETLMACGELGFERVHAFPFSPRPGTRSAMLATPSPPSMVRAGAQGFNPGFGRLPFQQVRMPHEPRLAQERNQRLIAHCREIAHLRWSRLCGNTCQVLLESRRSGAYEGYGEAYQQVRLPVAATASRVGDMCGELVAVNLDALHESVFTASLLG